MKFIGMDFHWKLFSNRAVVEHFEHVYVKENLSDPNLTFDFIEVLLPIEIFNRSINSEQNQCYVSAQTIRSRLISSNTSGSV